MRKEWKIVTDFIFLGSKITADGDCSHEIKRRLLLGGKLWPTWQHIKKQRHYFVNKGPSSQSYGFSSSYVWELDPKEGWVLKNWLIGKDPDAGKDWRCEEKGKTEDDRVGWHHWLDGHEFDQALGVGDGQGGLVCFSPRGHKELDTTDSTELIWTFGANFKVPAYNLSVTHYLITFYNKLWYI